MQFTQGEPDCVPAAVLAQHWFILGISRRGLTAGSEVCRKPQSMLGDVVQPGRPALNFRDILVYTGNQKDMLTP